MASKDHPEVGVLEQSAAPMFDPTRDTFLSSVDAVVSREDYPDEDSFQMAQSQWEALALHNLNEKPNSVDSSSIDRFRQYLVQLYGDKDTGQCSMLQNIPKASLFLGGKPAPSNFDQAHFLLKFMRAGGHNADMALSNLRQFLKLAKNSPSYYKWVGNLEVIRKVMKEEIFYSLAHRDKFGRRVNIVRCGQWDPTRASFQECFSTAHSLLELCSLDQRTQISGVTAIFDCKDFGFKQFRNVSIDNVRVTATAHQVRAISGTRPGRAFGFLFRSCSHQTVLLDCFWDRRRSLSGSDRST